MQIWTEPRRDDSVIGKSVNPRCFKNIKKPVNYFFNKKAWMTGKIFHEIMIKINKKMMLEQRNVLFFIDNCSSHKIENYSNISLILLPPNTTAILQPMDAGMIHSIKSRFRTKIV